jgi:putative copper resistance protein D
VQGTQFQQQVGGAALWASGDLIGLLFLIVVVTQWMRASDREAVREDRRLDRLEGSLTGR